jgi:ribosome biogenesis GTPase
MALFFSINLNQEDFIKGLVLRVESKDYYVLDTNTGKILRCSLKGKFKKEFNLKKDKLYHTDIVIVGDDVEFEINNDGTGVIFKVLERSNSLSRKVPKIRGASYRGERLEQIIAANIDTLYIVSSTANPPFNNKTIDRFLVAAESSRIEVKLIINKTDIADTEFIDDWINLYTEIGYKVFSVSAKTCKGIEEIKESLSGKRNLFWGQSGVGKSSLLNVLFPGLNLSTGEISTFNDRGTHTTVTSVMIKTSDDTYIIDTPGVREIDPFGVKKEDLGHFFIEFTGFIPECRFNTCTHQHEPGCAVIEAVENEEISAERYDSYLRILDTIEDDIIY